MAPMMARTRPWTEGGGTCEDCGERKTGAGIPGPLGDKQHQPEKRERQKNALGREEARLPPWPMHLGCEAKSPGLLSRQ